LNHIIYPEGIEAGFVVYMAVTFTVLVAASFFWKPMHRSASGGNEKQEQ
jgi:hypothetical protein